MDGDTYDRSGPLVASKVKMVRSLASPWVPVRALAWPLVDGALHVVGLKAVEHQLPFDCRIHFIGTHIHPHGESIELFNVTRQERVWKGAKQLDAANQMVGMEVYSSAEGYAVHAGDAFRLSSVYSNPTQKDIDAMAAVFFFYSMN